MILKIVLLVIALLITFFMWCMCKVAGDADDEYERMWKEKQENDKN